MYLMDVQDGREEGRGSPSESCVEQEVGKKKAGMF